MATPKAFALLATADRFLPQQHFLDCPYFSLSVLSEFAFTPYVTLSKRLPKTARFSDIVDVNKLDMEWRPYACI